MHPCLGAPFSFQTEHEYMPPQPIAQCKADPFPNSLTSVGTHGKKGHGPTCSAKWKHGISPARSWLQNPGRGRVEETFALGIKQQSPSCSPSSARGLNASTLHLVRGHTPSWQRRGSTVWRVLPLRLDLLHVYLNVRDAISSSQLSWKEEFPTP